MSFFKRFCALCLTIFALAACATQDNVLSVGNETPCPVLGKLAAGQQFNAVLFDDPRRIVTLEIVEASPAGYTISVDGNTISYFADGVVQQTFSPLRGAYTRFERTGKPVALCPGTHRFSMSAGMTAADRFDAYAQTSITTSFGDILVNYQYSNLSMECLYNPQLGFFRKCTGSLNRPEWNWEILAEK